MTNVTLPVIELRPYQQEIYQKVVNEGCKRVICVWSRRAGKDILLLNIIAALAIKEKGTYAYFLPTYTQAKKVIWKSISNDGRSMLDMALPKELILKKNDSDMSVTLINGSIIQFLGAESVDRIVGTNYKFVVFSEAALMDERPWSLIRPILMANKGGAAFISTPRSRNWFYDMWNRAREDKDWVTSLKTCYDTGVATEEDIEKERKEGMPESLIKQEYFCDFTAANEGSYYGQEIQKMREDGRISDFPIDDAIPVSTTFDLGISDATAIVFYQQIGEWVYVIDYYESNGQSLKDYARVLKEKGYMYNKHHLPHDANHRDLSTGITRLEFFREMGITNVETIPVKPITYGIECVHRLFPKCKIHSTRCQKLIKCLEMYRKEYDEKNNVFKDKPVHDYTSHACFTADTLVKMKDGYKRIDEVKVGDEVYISDGLYGEVTDSRCTGVKETIKLIFNNGVEIECTPDHNFITTKGLTRADSLGYNDEVIITEDSELWKNYCKNKPTHARDEFISNIKGLSTGFGKNKNSAVQTTKLTLVCVEKRKEMKPVYNITVRDHHCFFANGVLVSNCDSFRYLGEVIREETNAKLGSIMQIPMHGTYNPIKWS